MINFYNTIFLWLLPLSLLPLLIHLLSFKKSRIIKFSYTFLIEKIVKETSLKRKIVDIIILLLRCLIIFFLIIYISKPIVFYNPKGHKDINLIIAIDNSFSVRQRLINKTKLELFLDGLFKLLKDLQGNRIKIHILTFNETVYPINKNFDSISQLSFNRDNIKPTYTGTDLNSLINYTINFFNSYDKNSQNKVLIFTDLANHMFLDEQENSVLINKNNIDFLFCYPEIDVSNNYFKNVAVDLYDNLLNIKFEPVLEHKTGTFVVQFYLKNKLVDFMNIDLKKEKYEFNYSARDDIREFYGNLSLSPDSLNEDNNFYFYKNYLEDVRILCFINEPIYYRGLNSIKYYIDKLTISGISFNTYNYETILENNYYDKMVDEYENIIFINVPKLNIDVLKKLKDKRLIFFLSDGINDEEYEKFFEDIEFVAVEENKFSKFQLVFGEDKDFNEFISLFEISNINVSKRYRLTLKNKSSNWKVLLKFNDGSPALISDGNIFLFSFTLSKEWSNLVYKPFFVSFVKRVFSNKNDINIKNQYYISEVVTIKIKNPVIVFDVLTQKKLQEGLEYDVVKEGIKFYVPGVYSIETSDREKIHIVAVNIFPKESDTKIVDKIKIKHYFKNINNVTVNYLNLLKSNYGNEILKWCFGKEYSEEIFFIITILFILEMILSRVSKRKI